MEIIAVILVTVKGDLTMVAAVHMAKSGQVWLHFESKTDGICGHAVGEKVKCITMDFGLDNQKDERPSVKLGKTIGVEQV